MVWSSQEAALADRGHPAGGAHGKIGSVIDETPDLD
jgi:hypothetical protein